MHLSVSRSFYTTRFSPLLSLQATARLVEFGFFNQAEPIDRTNPIGGAVRNRADALSILQDTHKVTYPCYRCLLKYC